MDPATLRPLGRCGLDVTALSFGTAPIGGMFEAVTDDQAAATLEEAWSAGIRFFDTAPLYGLGSSEERLGRMLADKPREAFVVSTKVGRLILSSSDAESAHDISAWIGAQGRVPVFDFSYDGVLRSVDASLSRLGLDSVDVLHIHDPDDHHEEAIAGAYRALNRLRDERVVGAVGAGMNQSEMLMRFADEGDFDCFLLAGRFTLLDRSGRALLDLCAERGIGVICGGVFNSGVLADPKPGATYDYTAAPPSLIGRALEMASICDSHGTSLKAAALQFPFTHEAVATVLSGARTPDEIAENARALAAPIPDAVWNDLSAQAG
jgi:D-threo-aldose 1-dehydrogenase